jgi:hypothetical protein
MVTRGLLESGYLEGVIAHELGHLNSSDARLTAALYRLTTPPRKQVRRGLRTISLIATGSLAVMLTRAPWGAYWRAREHHADHYAARTLTAIPARHTQRVRAVSAHPLHPARGIHDQPRPFPPLIDAKAAGQLLGVPHTWLLAQARAGRIHTTASATTYALTPKTSHNG